jgi:cytochrome oxidase Cu insertion factor (SCO1/SenC/PrrC family)
MSHDAPNAAEPLALSVHALPSASTTLLDAPQRTRLGRIKMVLILLACASPVIASYFTFYVIRPSGQPSHGVLAQPPVDIPAATALPLADLQGHTVDPRSLRDQWLLVVVADGVCDSTCEKLLYAQRQLRETLGKEKDRLDRVWLVTGDQPPRADLLPALAEASVLRAPRDAVAAWLKPAQGESLSAHLYLVDPMGVWMMRFPAAFEPAKVKRDIERVLRASTSWDRAGRDPAIVGPVTTTSGLAR